MEKNALFLVRFSLVLLLSAIIFGVLAAFVFIDSDVVLSFRKLRPLHVSSALFWILTAASSSVLIYIKKPDDHPNRVDINLVRIFKFLWIGTILVILASFFDGKFGGREYWEFPPFLAVPLLIAWSVFAVVYFRAISGHSRKWPVYFWMWTTGVVFFILTYAEANLWMIPWFRDNVIRDITVQWKSNGALVGSWNMLIYGTSMYLMCRISNDDKVAYKPISFFFYFLGFTNLLFNWGHHTYPVPAASWIRQVSYAISMTEWIIFLNIIRNWRKTVSEASRHLHIVSYNFLLASEFWVFANLLLALLMSIPAVNIYTHGTHITVAHAMGTTIGINSMILMASVFYIFDIAEWKGTWVKIGFWLANVFLLIFWLSLIAAGIIKGYYTIELPATPFADIMSKISPFMISVAVSGSGLMLGLGILSVFLLTRRRVL